MSKKTLIRIQIFIIPLCLMLLSSCSRFGFLGNKSKYTPIEIESFGDFFSLYLILQLSILFIGVLIAIPLGKDASNISTLLHFIWIVSYRDYGFFIVLGLFCFTQIVLMITIPIILVFWARFDK